MVELYQSLAVARLDVVLASVPHVLDRLPCPPHGVVQRVHATMRVSLSLEKRWVCNCGPMFVGWVQTKIKDRLRLRILCFLLGIGLAIVAGRVVIYSQGVNFASFFDLSCFLFLLVVIGLASALCDSLMFGCSVNLRIPHTSYFIISCSTAAYYYDL